MSAALAFWVAFGSLILSAVCTTLHLSLRGLSRSRLEQFAGAGAKSSRDRTARIIEDRPGHAASIAFPRVMANIVFALATLVWVSQMKDHPDSVGFTKSDIVIAAVIATPLLWLFGYVLPLSIATHAGERTVLVFSSLIRVVHLAMTPIRRVLHVMDEAVRRLAGAQESSAQDAISAELLSMAEMGKAEGHFDEAERDMIEGVVSFRTTTVERIMTPRTEVEAIDLTDDLDKVRVLVEACGHSRIPVYRENMDDIVGILYAKDLLRWLGDGSPGEPFRLENIVRKALFVPEQKTVRELLTELVRDKVHLAMVADEYGGTSGLVTIEDIIEEVFGEIRDEYDHEEEDEPSIEVDLPSGSAEMDAALRVDDANDKLEALGVEIPESDEYDTIGGYVVTTLGHIPEAGETISLDSATLAVLEASPTRVLRAIIEVRDEAPAVSLSDDEASPDSTSAK